MRTKLLVILFFCCIALGCSFMARAVYEERVISSMIEKARIMNIQNESNALKQRVKKLEEAKKKSMTLTRYLTYPLKTFNAKLTQGYGQNLLAYGGMGLNGHIGLDFAAPEGTPVYAAHDGIVFESWNDRTGKRIGYGGRVKLRYRNGSNGMETVYAHLSKTAVMVGEQVKDGQLIGYTGDTGFSTRPHLHFGVRFLWFCDKGGSQVSFPCEVINGNNGMLGWVDPMPYILKNK